MQVYSKVKEIKEDGSLITNNNYYEAPCSEINEKQMKSFDCYGPCGNEDIKPADVDYATPNKITVEIDRPRF